MFKLIKTILSVDCIINGAIPKARVPNTTSFFNFKYFFLIFNIVLFPNKNLSTNIADTNCEVTVASAAPLTPILNPNIKIGSSIIFSPAPIATVTIPIVVNPCVLIYGFIPTAT